MKRIYYNIAVDDLCTDKCPYNITIGTQLNQTETVVNISRLKQIIKVGSWVCYQHCKYCNTHNTKERWIDCKYKEYKYDI